MMTDGKAHREEDFHEIFLNELRELLDRASPNTLEEYIDCFLSYDVSENRQVSADVVEILFEKATEKPKLAPLYAELCKAQVKEELTSGQEENHFHEALVTRAQATFEQSIEENLTFLHQQVPHKNSADQRWDNKMSEYAQCQARKKKFGSVTFIGQLFRQKLFSTSFISWCLLDLLKATVNGNKRVPKDVEEDISCAIHLLDSIGDMLEVDDKADEFDKFYRFLYKIRKSVSIRTNARILSLEERRRNGWWPKVLVEEFLNESEVTEKQKKTPIDNTEVKFRDTMNDGFMDDISIINSEKSTVDDLTDVISKTASEIRDQKLIKCHIPKTTCIIGWFSQLSGILLMAAICCFFLLARIVPSLDNFLVGMTAVFLATQLFESAVILSLRVEALKGNIDGKLLKKWSRIALFQFLCVLTAFLFASFRRLTLLNEIIRGRKIEADDANALISETQIIFPFFVFYVLKIYLSAWFVHRLRRKGGLLQVAENREEKRTTQGTFDANEQIV